MSSADITIDRTLPNSLESERAVLGAILPGKKAIFAAAEVLTAEDFYLEAHREIFRARIRQIKPEFYLDGELAQCSRDARGVGAEGRCRCPVRFGAVG